MTDAQRYPAQVFYSEDDEGFIAVASDLPGCSAFGDTQEEAVAELRSAIAAWQIAATKAGNPIPEPSKPQLDDLPSGKILLRLPRSLHAMLIEKAKQDNVSLNQHLVSVLTASTAAHYIRSVVSEQLENARLRWDRALATHHIVNNIVNNPVMILTTNRQVVATRWHENPSNFFPVTSVMNITSDYVDG